MATAHERIVLNYDELKTRTFAARRDGSWLVAVFVGIALYHLVTSFVFFFESGGSPFADIFLFAIFHTILSLAFCIIVPVIMTAVFYARHGAHLVAPIASHLAILFIFFVTTLASGLLTTILIWQHYDATLVAFVRDANWIRTMALFTITTFIAALCAAVATTVINNNLVHVQCMPAVATARRVAVPSAQPSEAMKILSSSMIRRQATSYVNTGEVRLDMAPRHSGAMAVTVKPALSRYQYIVTSYDSLPWFNGLHVLQWLHGLFLLIMSFLLYLQSENVDAITNPWTFTLVYAILGAVLLITHLFLLFWYFNAYAELSSACALVAKLTFATFLATWFFSLLALGMWLQKFSPTCCAATVPSVLVDPVAYTLYHNALALGAMPLFVLIPVLILAVTHQFKPERQTLYKGSIADTFGGLDTSTAQLLAGEM